MKTAVVLAFHLLLSYAKALGQLLCMRRGLRMSTAMKFTVGFMGYEQDRSLMRRGTTTNMYNAMYMLVLPMKKPYGWHPVIMPMDTFTTL